MRTGLILTIVLLHPICLSINEGLPVDFYAAPIVSLASMSLFHTGHVAQANSAPSADAFNSHLGVLSPHPRHNMVACSHVHAMLNMICPGLRNRLMLWHGNQQ